MPGRASGRAKADQEATYAASLLQRAHSPTTARRIYDEKVKHKPLHLRRPEASSTDRTLRSTTAKATPSTSTTPKSASKDKRAVRQQHRTQATAAALSSARRARNGRRTPLPKPLSAAAKRRLGLHAIPPRERKFALYKGLNRLWRGYMREILGLRGEGGAGAAYVSRDFAGPRVASADLHGADVAVVRCRCVSRVGVRGIVVRDGKFSLKLVTEGDRVLTIPKEHTVFRIEVPLVDSDEEGTGGDERPARAGSAPSAAPRPLVFELQGSQIANRAAERATKKFKMHLPPDL